MAEYQTSIDIAAPPDVVYDYLTTADGVTAWMGEHAELDPRPDGMFAVDIAGYPIRGRYLHVERPTRVMVSWGVAGSEDLPSGASTVDFRLTRIDGGTRVDLTHSDLPDAQLPGHADGWQHFLTRLAIVVPGGDPGPDLWRPLPERTSHG
ncbi:SRPBCC domain-containing protein [Ruania alkalisoli]|uniref:SRPBCC domain-containing protein n=1 Tax=Ruania alkalisoli TaxID=2779775 RepID=A0A7M1SZL2_9MICO|nr:SRPBCC domain-containing protein [Ruania alkalisoli]QOR72182.1 SRPBCC domain-containing protein [Ruania alkalisoli]